LPACDISFTMSFQKNVHNQPNIYFYCYDRDIPSGGIKVLYQHVDILNKHGFAAFILHQTPGFRCTWFENVTPIVSMTELRIRASDYLVIPEEIFPELNKAARGLKKVVFNQNCYYSFLHGHSLEKTDIITTYQDKEVIAALVVSEDSKEYLSYVFPALKVIRIHNAIDPNVFSYNRQKNPLISFMPRKHFEDILQVINILKYRNALGDFEIVSIYDKTEREVAQILRESIIFLSFGYPEGFSLPPAEAMACGCIVIGYHGMGGKEFFRSEFSYPINCGDIISFAQTVEKVIELYKFDKDILIKRGELASHFMLNNYSLERQEKDVIKFWNDIIKSSALG
jgi:glycosyltransferase involved in cell wall biosynthesis